MQEWVTLMTFTYPHESYVIRGVLQAAGIETFLKDEITVQVDNFLSNAVGGIQLQVISGQVDNAREVLMLNGYLDDKGKPVVEKKHVEVLDMEQQDGTLCPFCKSENTTETKTASMVTVISLLLFRLPLPVFKKDNYCFDCESSWKYKKVKKMK